MLDLARIAMETDSTRLIPIYIHQKDGKPNISGVDTGTHPLTHHGNQPEKLDQLKLIGTSLGNDNANNNFPVLIAGGGFRHAQNIAFGGNHDYPLPNWLISVLQRFGIETDQFDTATGTMRGLEIL